MYQDFVQKLSNSSLTSINVGSTVWYKKMYVNSLIFESPHLKGLTVNEKTLLIGLSSLLPKLSLSLYPYAFNNNFCNKEYFI